MGLNICAHICCIEKITYGYFSTTRGTTHDWIRATCEHLFRSLESVLRKLGVLSSNLQLFFV